MCLNNYMLEDLQPYTKLVPCSMTNLREELNKLATSLKHIPDFYNQTKVLLVEGETEGAFLEKLRESHALPFVWLIVEVYKGQGNRRPARLQMLFDKYQREGYKVYIQGDADGRETDLFSDLVQKCHLSKTQTFLFRYDFETAIPSEILYVALRELGELQGVEEQEFKQRYTEHTGSVNSLLRDFYKVNINSFKIQLAEMVGELLNTRWWNWYHEQDFMQSELGQFLSFIQQIR